MFFELFKNITFLSFLTNIFFRFIMSILTSSILSLVLFPLFIHMLHKFNIGQEVRHDGPNNHLQKQGTPTAGGFLILLNISATTLLWADLTHVGIWLLMMILIGYGTIGIFDDYRKIKCKNSQGISGRWKLFWQSMIGIFVFLIYALDFSSMPFSSVINIPFISHKIFYLQIPMGLYAMLSIFVLLGTSNGVNLTDGLDGLAIVPVIISSIVFSFFAYIAGSNLLNYFDVVQVAGVQELTIFCGAMIGAGIGFLWYNTYPALIFMGDTGSLSLGGVLGLLSILTKTELISIFLHGVFLIEIISVMIQVLSLRFLSGKRIFKMAPIHHHFELLGCPEPRLIVRFWILGIFCAFWGIVSLIIKLNLEQ